MTEEEYLILSDILWAERCIKKHNSLYNNIIQFNRENDITFVNKVYNYYHKIDKIPSCKICDNPVKFHNKSYSIYCSNRCKNSDPEFKATREDSMLKKYGVKSLIGSKECREKIKKTNIEKYGFEVSSKSDLVRKKVSISKKNATPEEKKNTNNKRAETNIEKYGVDNVAKSEIVKAKTINSNINKWGCEFPIMDKSVVEKRKNNYIKKTGKDHHFKISDILNKMQVSRKETMSNNYLKKLNNLNLSVVDYKSGTLDIFCDKCNKMYSILVYVLYQRISENRTICINCNPLYNKTSSHHTEIINFLEKNNIVSIKNDRKILNGKEIDIYIPTKNIAIEFNGLYWHSELYKNKTYHLDKKNSCENKGIRLIHIWEDDWVNKRDICISYLSNSLGLCANKIYGRKCELKEIHDTNIVRDFLNNNHLQGYSSSSIKLGLFYENELVSVMTFGYRNTNSKKEYELIRFCNKINYTVIGSATKLFKYFISNYDYDTIISYSDESSFTGGIYEKMGFLYEHTSPPNYFWVVDGIRKHRFNYNKKKLVKIGHDPNKSEVEIMHELGYYRIWGCGQKRWIYENKKV